MRENANEKKAITVIAPTFSPVDLGDKAQPFFLPRCVLEIETLVLVCRGFLSFFALTLGLSVLLDVYLSVN